MGIKLTKQGLCLKKTTLRLTKWKFQVFQGQKLGHKLQQVRDKSILIQNTEEKVNAELFLFNASSMNVKSYYRRHTSLVAIETSRPTFTWVGNNM